MPADGHPSTIPLHHLPRSASCHAAAAAQAASSLLLKHNSSSSNRLYQIRKPTCPAKTNKKTPTTTYTIHLILLGYFSG